MSKHRSKRRSCALCKPHKMGHAPKDTDRQNMEERLARKEAARWLRKQLPSRLDPKEDL